MSDEMFLNTTGKLLINVKPSYTITMHNPDGEVGRLDFNGPKLVFTGDAEESAKVFFDYLAMIWEQRLQEEREAEREACAELCQEMEDRENPYERNVAVLDCASAIRARGET